MTHLQIYIAANLMDPVTEETSDELRDRLALMGIEVEALREY